VAAWEARFVRDVPGSWWATGSFEEVRQLPGLERSVTSPAEVAPELDPPRRPAYLPIGDRWAVRLERYCEQFDRLEGGRRGAGVQWLLERIYGWEPEHDAPYGSYRTGERKFLGWPCSLAYFIAQLGVEVRGRRRARNPRRQANSVAWREDHERGRLRTPGPLSDAYWERLEDAGL
jgi:hypothetical protein